jgi:V/A-type H+-transporting ATPase subunit A
MRVAGALWSLDSSLAHRRHFPAVNPRLSYSLYHDQLRGFFAGEAAVDWTPTAFEAMALLQKEEELQEVVQLVGIESLPDSERVVLESGKMIREAYLAQSAFHERDAFCSLSKQYGMLAVILHLHRRLLGALDGGLALEDLLGLPLRDHVARMRDLPGEGIGEALEGLRHRLDAIIDEALRGAQGPGETGEGS